MDRLTTHDPNRRLVACRANCEAWDAIYDRLAAYEDTDLEPKEIAQLITARPGITGILKDLLELSYYRRAEAEDRLIVLRETDYALPDIMDLCLVRIEPGGAPPFWTVATYCGEDAWETESAGRWQGPFVTDYAILRRFGPTIEEAEAALKEGQP